MNGMKRFGVCAVAAMLLLPLSASAQNPWDGQFNFDQLNADFLAQPAVNSEIVPGDDAESGTPEEGIDEVAEFRLLEFILNNPSESVNGQEVYDAFAAIYPIADNRVKNTTVGLLFRVAGTKVLTAFLVRSVPVGLGLAGPFGISGSNAFTQPELDQLNALSRPDLLSASGDLDEDGVTNLQEWENADLGGGQTYEQRVALFVTLATSGTQESVNVNPNSATIFKGQTLQLGASSTDSEDGFNWSSNNQSVATVSATGLVTAVSRGTATITAQGTNSNAVGTATITVENPQWFDLCAIDNSFANQGEIFGSLAGTLGLPFNSFAEFDLDQDGVPDAWQLHHLAYVLCQGGFGLATKNVVPGTVVAEFQANLGEISTLISELGAFVNFLGTANTDISGYAAILAASSDVACNDPSNLPSPLDGIYASLFGPTPIDLALAGIAAEASTAAGDFGPLALVLPSLAELLAGLSGVSTEYGMAINGLVPFSGINDLNQAMQLVAGIAQFHAMGCLTDPAEQAAAGSLAAAVATPPTVAVPSFTVYGASSKAPGEPFAGEGDYNNDGTTNATIAGFVQGGGGGANDYVAGVTGELGDFWIGNPALSAVGMLGLGAALSALSAAGAFALRRKKK
jgi:hypothetical protein